VLRERGRDRAHAVPRKFGHQQDYVAAYGRSLLKTAFEACGREAPAPDAPAGAAASPLSEAN
jgi:hypothetical protein